MRFETAYVDGLPFAKAMGGSPKVGTGSRLYRYSVYIEKGTRVRREKFVRTVEEILGDERSWIKGGAVSFQRVDEGADTHCVLALPDTVDRLCAPLDTEGKVSCCVGPKVVLNVKRWRNAVEHWTGSVADLSADGRQPRVRASDGARPRLLPGAGTRRSGDDAADLWPSGLRGELVAAGIRALGRKDDRRTL